MDEPLPDDPTLVSLRRAVSASPSDVELRLLLAERLLSAGRVDESVTECADALTRDPAHSRARELMSRALSSSAAAVSSHSSGDEGPSDPMGVGHFDWRSAEQDVADVVPPMFVEGEEASAVQSHLTGTDAWEVTDAGVTLADVAGMEQVKERLELAFLAPMRHPELRRMYGKSLRGGLLLYGPPGCGKTFVARAIAGELGAAFLAVGLADILDMWVGSSERNVHELFALARQKAPCVVFLDEIDSLGRKRSQTRFSGTRGAVTQLLSELDGVEANNEGVFVLAATNHPWDVDMALRRPGRLDRTLLVLPPDLPARQAVFRFHLADRPIGGVDLARLAKLTDGYSGADIAHVCECASEHAMLDGIRSGEIRLISQQDLEGAIREVKPSMGQWFETARNVVTFADTDGEYADLRAYLKRIKKL